MNEIHHHIFYQYVTPDGVIGGSNHLCKIFQTMDFPINCELRIMNYEFIRATTRDRPYGLIIILQMYFPTIMNYKSILTIHKHFQQ